MSEKIAEYQEKWEKVNKELKNDKLEPDERAKLESEKEEISIEMPKAQEKMDNETKKLEKGLKKKSGLSKISKEDIDKKAAELDRKIKICDIAAKNLLEGKDWDHIEARVNDYENKVYKDKNGNLEENIKKTREEKADKFQLKMPEDKTGSEQEKAGDNKAVNLTELATVKKPSIFSKIGNFFKNMKNKIFNKDLGNTEKLDIEKLEVEKPKAEQTKENFLEELKVVAEKGLDGIEAEKKEAERLAKLARLKDLQEKTGRGDQLSWMKDKGKESMSDINKKAEELRKAHEEGLRNKGGNER